MWYCQRVLEWSLALGRPACNVCVVTWPCRILRAKVTWMKVHSFKTLYQTTLWAPDNTLDILLFAGKTLWNYVCHDGSSQTYFSTNLRKLKLWADTSIMWGDIAYAVIVGGNIQYLAAVALPHCMDLKLFIDLFAMSGNFSLLLIGQSVFHTHNDCYIVLCW